MKRRILFFVLGTCLGLTGLAQTKDSKPNSPKEDIKVNREYDEQGNLIKFDSVYSYSWSGDTTMMKSFSPKDFENLFGNHFGFFSDSTSAGNPFFEDFDLLFAQPFGNKQDSVLMEKFGHNRFHSFNFESDSLALNRFKGLDDFFGQMNRDKTDSISSKAPKVQSNKHSRTIDDILKMMQQQMQEMEEYQRKFFQYHQSLENQPKLKEF